MKDAFDAILRPEQAKYLATLEGPRDALLVKMEAHAAAERQPISDPEVASFLALTVALRQPKLVVELGTNIGYGAIVMARAAGHGARVVTIERSPTLVATARGYAAEAGLADRIEVREGSALDELARFAPASIDLAYIDCVKEEYPAYLDLLVPRLSSRGVIVADNVLWKGLVAADAVPEGELARTGALREFNRRLTTHPELRASVLPFGDGVAVAMKR